MSKRVKQPYVSGKRMADATVEARIDALLVRLDSLLEQAKVEVDTAIVAESTIPAAWLR